MDPVVMHLNISMSRVFLPCREYSRSSECVVVCKGPRLFDLRNQMITDSRVYRDSLPVPVFIPAERFSHVDYGRPSPLNTSSRNGPTNWTFRQDVSIKCLHVDISHVIPGPPSFPGD